MSDDNGVPGEGESYDFGSGAGFYVDAAQAPDSGTAGTAIA